MIQILGYIFISIILATLVTISDYFLPGSYLTKFIDGSFIETFAFLVGLNLTAIVFLLGQLISFEEKYKNNILFEKTRKEIKQNSFFLFGSFCLSLILLIIRPDLNQDISFIKNITYYIMNGFIIAIFILAMITIFEILGAVFVLSKPQK
jgi:hypothetical protein